MSRTRRLFSYLALLVICLADSGVCSPFTAHPGRKNAGNRIHHKIWQSFRSRVQPKDNLVQTIASLNLTALPYNPETTMNPVQIIVNRGYSVASYSVTTDDGYILELHRIPYGKNLTTTNAVTGKPVWLQHGLLGSSANWLIVPSNHSLAFRLADLGYDVWLGNIRGNTYSRKHVTMNPSSQEAYWKFSWDEMGKYDVPAILEFILTKTGRDKLIYIGHSMGCSMFFVAMSTFPQLGSKIELMVALAPAVSLGGMASPIMRAVAPFVKQVEMLFRLFRVRNFASNDSHFSYLVRRFCQRNAFKAGICRNILFRIVGDNPETLDLVSRIRSVLTGLQTVPNLLPVIDGHTPSGTSIHTLAHFAMNHNSGQSFIAYDHGMIGNYLRYGQFRPPAYDLTKVSPPIYLFYGPNDLLVRPADVDWLASQLPNLKEVVQVDSKYYNHLDFLWERNNNKLLYDRVISILPPPT